MFVKGYKMTEEHKRKIGEANRIALKGRDVSPQCREACIRKTVGVPRSEEFKRRISYMNKVNNTAQYLHSPKAKESFLKSVCRGKKHWNWKGGTARSPYPKEFNRVLKYEIKKRDGFRCVICSVEKSLSIHHIDEDKNNNSLNNLVTMCLSCHTSMHNKRMRFNVVTRIFSKIQE